MKITILIRDDYFRFGSVFIKKNNQIEIFLKKTETGSNRPVSVRFFRKKTGSNRLSSNFSVWLGFFQFDSVFSVRFGFFSFSLIKPKPNQTGRFFLNFNRFFSWFGFFVIFFCLFAHP